MAQKIKEFQIQEFVANKLKRVGHSHTVMKKTPLGEKIMIYASRPGLVVGRHGGNIKELTQDLKREFNLENPQIEIQEVEKIFLDANIVAEKIADSIERFGINRFKGVGHKMMEKVMEAGALGIEIIMSGKIPGARARSWRFYQGYLKKSGDMAVTHVRRACKTALLKTGMIGIRISILPPELKGLEDIKVRKAGEETAPAEEKKEESKEEVKEKKKRTRRKKNEEKVEEKTEEVKEEKIEANVEASE